jgi:hypothetical protein
MRIQHLHLAAPSGFRTALQAETLCGHDRPNESVVSENDPEWQANPQRRCRQCERRAAKMETDNREAARLKTWNK